MNFVTIENKKYNVRFSMRAFVEFERITGKQLMSLDTQKTDFDTIVTLCYVALIDGARKTKSKLTKEENKEWLIDCISDDMDIMNEILKAFGDSTKKKKTRKKAR